MSFVTIDHLHVRYGKFEAVKGISFTIPKGDIFGFIGPNGAGKSTTIKVLATLIRPTAGTASIAGVDVVKDPQRIRRLIGYVPDFFGVYQDLSVREYLHFFAAAYDIERAKRERLVGDALALTDLSHKIDAPVDGLSRGMKQRLSLARVLLHDPELLLLDEPASGLDPRARIEMRELLKELRRLGKTILISSHILHELAQLCTRIGIIEQGKLMAEGSVEELFRRLDLTRIIHVQAVEATPAHLEGIRQLAGVASVEQQADRIAIRCRDGEVAVEDLHDALVRLGLRLRMFQPEALDMETAFMKLTEGRTA